MALLARTRVRVALAFLVLVSTVAIVTTAPAARANSTAGIARNAWIITDLAASTATATNAPVGATTSSPSPVKGRLPGFLGVVNTVSTLGGLLGFFGDGDSAPPDYPPVEGGDAGASYYTTTSFSGGPANATWTLNGPHNSTSGLVNVTIQPTIGGTVHRGYSSRCKDANGALYGGPNASGWSSNGGVPISYGAQSCGVGGTLFDMTIYANAGQQRNHTIGTVLTFGPPLLAVPPAEVPRYIDSTITCRTPGGPDQIITERYGPFTVDPADPSATTIDVPDLTCPPGSFLASGTRTMDTPTAAPGQQTTPLTDYAAPPWVETQANRFPECLPVGSTLCQLDVHIIIGPATTGDAEPQYDPEGNPKYKDCSRFLPAANPCEDWYTDPARDRNYQCRFGPYVVSLRVCEPLKRIYTTTPTITPTPDPETITPETPPEPIPPTVDPTPDETPGLGNCVPKGLGILNPWWVFKGVACALKWAFVPQTALSDRIARLRLDFSTKAPFSWFGPVLALPAFTVPDGECPDWRVKIGSFYDKNIVCNSSFTQAIVGSRPWLLAGMLALAFWPLIRGLMFASVPLLKPVPTDGGGR